MKGYFSSLAKQSSVSIRGGKKNGGRVPPAPMTETLAPLHSERVLFVDSTPTTVGPVHDSQTIERTPLQAISQDLPAPIESPNNVSESRSTSRSFAPPARSNSSRQPRTGDRLGPVAPLETSLSMTNSPAPAPEDSKDPLAPLVESPDVELEGQAAKQGGVIRVGEPENPTETKTTKAPESSSERFRRDVPIAASIPHEYLEGVREWLDSPPIEIEASEHRKTLKQSPESAFVAVKDPGHSPRPTLVDPKAPAQNEIQEFSLSIGSISIVVEEPPAPRPQPNNVPPQTAATVGPAPPAHDAFALSRRYFRGF